MLEPHGEYNPSKEYTLDASSQLTALSIEQQHSLSLIGLTLAGYAYVIAINDAQQVKPVTFTYQNKSYTARQHLEVFAVGNHQE